MAARIDSKVVVNSWLTQFVRIVSVFLLLTYLFTSVPKSYAADFSSRSVTVASPLASQSTSHTFRFTTITSGSVGSIVLEYCSNLPFYGAPCTAPAGLVANSSSITTQTGITGLSISGPDSTVNRVVLTRANSVINTTPVVLVLSNVINQSAPSGTVYVRISTHAANNGSGAPIDSGAVVYTTSIGVGVGGYVPPFLTFCVGITVAIDCSSASGSLLDLGELSSTQTKSATSQMSVSTNDPTGYNLFVSGGTMTAGNEVIPALSSSSGSSIGVSQFGINLRANSSPSVGSAVSGVGTGVPTANYNNTNVFRYNDGELVASSPITTDYNRFTVSYIVNVSEDQRPGVYASSFTYTAIASF